MTGGDFALQSACADEVLPGNDTVQVVFHRQDFYCTHPCHFSLKYSKYGLQKTVRIQTAGRLMFMFMFFSSNLEIGIERGLHTLLSSRFSGGSRKYSWISVFLPPSPAGPSDLWGIQDESGAGEAIHLQCARLLPGECGDPLLCLTGVTPTFQQGSNSLLTIMPAVGFPSSPRYHIVKDPSPSSSSSSSMC